uniref:Tumor protein p53-inducible protein 11 n=1 Tax=Ornithorhynchus anatinus TaxID=9258 RepID=A0A6I8N064_ORNAN
MAAKQPPPLMKKHSQTDLVSRLKTRKILGVGGEDDDGEVHRSKGMAVCLGCPLLRRCHYGPRLPRPALRCHL